MQNGKIGVTTENIFPVIKKFLYSDHEIFLRELVSNAVDASQKLKTLVASGECDCDTSNLKVEVKVDTEARTLTISDNGIGMSAEEVDKYINQIAFSGAEEFMEKYKNQNIIGHFGLGFYSAFMVADRVEIVTQSWRESEPTMVWACDGSPEFTMTESAVKRSRGTDIILYLSEDNAEFAQQARIRDMLRKYCRFLPIPIVCGHEQEWKDGKYVDTDRDFVVNDTDPLWTRNPSELTDEQYLKFYHEFYPAGEDPLFWIHLNIDYPFNLTGILYFPKIRNNFEIQKNRIQLYSNQVYVTDSVEGIVPEFLTLLHGVIDSPDIPLNVSRSYLQNDSNVRKISGYITRKVADKLQEIFSAHRDDYESKWDDLKIFIEYGVVTDEKFAERADKFMLLKSVDEKYYTFEEYREKITPSQTDKNGNIIYLYTEDTVGKYTFIEGAKAQGYDVLLMNGPLDNHFISWFENGHKDSRFVRVDSEIVDKLIDKGNDAAMSFSSEQQEIMRPVFESRLPESDGIFYNVSFEAMSPEAAPITVTQDEYMRRMKEMAAMSGDSMSRFYGQMPDNYTLAVNANHPLIIDLLEDVERQYGKDLQTVNEQIDSARKEENTLNELLKDKKESDLTDEEKQKRTELSEKVGTLMSERNERLREIGASNDIVKQLIDLALLSNGMLKGQQLTDFIKRSVELIGK